jgi:UDP-N-acetylglucosamine--N-acetylmuramyl-(pentapeptide) pyrophosphoryl-undecaprenol N-acetylglucosamine transferase
MATIVMAGGGTGGHVVPLLVVARELKACGHECVFIGTRSGFEAKLVPGTGFPLEFIEIGGLNRVGLAQVTRTLIQLPLSILKARGLQGRFQAGVIFSMGGYVAGPVVLAGLWRRLPIVVMEPNALPGLSNRYVARFVTRALLNFPEAARFFPPGRSTITGLPVRPEFFAIRPKARETTLTVLITGGSQGSRRLNEAAQQSWNYFREAAFPVRFIHQTGSADCAALAKRFAESGMQGHVVPYIEDMPAAFASADLVIARAGAGSLAELAAAGKPAVLVPLPGATDEHQLRNAEAFSKAGAARLVLDNEMDGGRLFEEVSKLSSQPAVLKRIGDQARKFSHPEAARQTAEIVEACLA